jgi:hypothetical protein
MMTAVGGALVAVGAGGGAGWQPASKMPMMRMARSLRLIDLLCHGVRQAAGLELHADEAAQLARLAGRVHAQDGQVPPVGLADPFQALQGGGLSCAVRPQQPDDLAGLHLEADVVRGDDAAVGLAQVMDLDDGRYSFTPS